MNTERRGTACRRWGPELVRLACGERDEPSPDLRAHLMACDECRGQFEAGTELVGALRAALAPDPLPVGLAAEIEGRLAIAGSSARRRWVLPVRLLGTAAAAGLLAAILLPWERSPERAATLMPAPAILLTQDDAAAIVAACVLLRWDSPAWDSAEVVTDQIEEVSRTIGREACASSSLPWGPEDDWDVPRPLPGTSDAGFAPEVYALAAGESSAVERLAGVRPVARSGLCPTSPG